MANSRLDFIDLLKGLAIIGVVLVHFNGQWKCPNHYINTASAIGARCPQLFFIVSAFLTWMSIDKRQPFSVKGFLKKRVVKIAPLYFFSILLVGIIPQLKLINWDPINVLTHILFINGLFPTYINSLMGVEWYIADLALFYLTTPLIWKYARTLKSVVCLLVGAVLINVTFTVITNEVFSTEIASSRWYEMYFHTFCIVNQMPIWLMGGGNLLFV